MCATKGEGVECTPMSSDGSYPTRASRRAERAPQQSGRASAGTATAILIIAAIIGFAGGAIAGNSANGGNDEPLAGETQDPVTDSSPDNASDDGNDENGDDNESEPGGGVTLNASPSSVSAGDRIDLTGRIDPPAANVELRVERSVGDTESWDSFPNADDPVTATTNANGEFSTWVQSSRQGVNHWKLVGTVDGEFVESNVVEVTIN